MDAPAVSVAAAMAIERRVDTLISTLRESCADDLPATGHPSWHERPAFLIQMNDS
jgi:hypothetical protein